MSLPRLLPWSGRCGPFLAGVALLLLVGSFTLSFVMGERTSLAEGLGHPGDTLRVVATADTETTPFVGPQRLTAAVTAFATQRQLAVAYSASSAPDVLTVVDQHARFTVADPALVAGLVPGDGRGAALVSTVVTEADRPAVVPDGVVLAGLFTPTVAFDGSLPTVLLDADAAPFASGIFLFAGAAADPGPVTALFARQGMQVQDATVYEVLTLGSALTSRYGMFAWALFGVATLAGLLTVHLHATPGRARLITAAVLGATRGQLRGLVVRRVLPPVLLGTGAGVVVAAAGMLAVADRILVPLPVAALALLAAVGVCAAVWTLILAAVSAGETRRCRRVVAC